MRRVVALSQEVLAGVNQVERADSILARTGLCMFMQQLGQRPRIGERQALGSLDFELERPLRIVLSEAASQANGYDTGLC